MAQIESNKGIENFTPESALNVPAIVIIDEIDLHIHPSWRQHVLPFLLSTFPETQFVVTTNIPQVITSVKPENIRILDGNSCEKAEHPTFGAQSSDVLQSIFGVSPIPVNKVTQMIDEYLELVNDEQGEGEEALKLRREIEKYLPGDVILTRSDMLMKRQRILKGIR
jgi:predicted ATP-binding protein involved in virulence